ncbi:MAG: hypothetical protein ACK4E8_05430 [Lacibacter sp.]|jgi:outer membrane lipoprotein-sorting protein
MKPMRIFALLLVTAFGFVQAQAQTADEIVSKYLAAIGGADNWKKVNSMVQTGSMNVQGADIQVTMTTLHNQGTRQDISLMGMSGYQIVTPTEGWSFMPFQGQAAPEAMSADEVKDGQDGLDAQGPLVDYAAKGHKVEYLGKENVEGTECHKLKLTYKWGKVETMYFHPQTFYLVQTVSVRKVNGQEFELSTGYSNHTKLPEGIVVPMNISIPLGPGFNADMTIEKVEINKPVDASVFKPAK